ncbi:MAG TPA: PilN domain-containing protein [Anaerohalosphaeraceae bacterium]|jgi:Tfp pilus assembly protein PilN|nr:PilN domain-containing protein [Anaerohalosphaeraceae bacterium]
MKKKTGIQGDLRLAAESKKSGQIKLSAGLLWSSTQNLGQAVLLRQEAQTIECLGCETVAGDRRPVDWAVRLAGLNPQEQTKISVQTGLNSSQVGFYVFDVPSMPEPQLSSIVRTQAEGVLPLPISSMRLAWRVDLAQPANRCILAAVRSEVYQQARDWGIPQEGGAVIPDAVGLIACWHACFESARHQALALTVGTDQAVAVLTEEGRILNLVRIDVDPDASARLLIGDLLQSLATLGSDMQSTEIFLLSGGSDRHPQLAEELKKEGFHVHLSGLDRDKMRRIKNADPDAIQRCPEAFGLALLGLDGRAMDFDFSVERASPSLTMRQQMLSAPVLRAAVGILLAAAVCVLGLYWKEKTELRTLQRRLSVSDEGQTAQQLLAMMDYRQHVAKARPDLLELLDLLRQVQPEGLLLDQFTFERGKPVELRGIADSYEQAYEFQKKLQQRSEIRQVQLLEPTLDEKTKKINFRIRFLYRSFSG